MGASISVVEKALLNVKKMPRSRRLRVLDVGCQNLYLSTSDQVVSFFNRWKPSFDPVKVRQYADMIAIGSEIDSVIGGVNGAWLGDLLTKAGFYYLSYDIFAGFKTFIFDLNQDSVPSKHFGLFDVVLNCGTSEHVIGQYNCFKVIHDATKVGGIMYHEVPFSGYLDHGYFNYQPQLFIDLAKINGYEIIEVSVGEPSGPENVISRIFQPYLTKGLNLGSIDHSSWINNLVPTSGFSILLRKIIDAPFKVTLETSTTAGNVTQSIKDSYGTSRGGNLGTLLKTKIKLLNRLHDPTLSYEDLMDFYRLFMATSPDAYFPLELERKCLVLALVNWPERQDLINRLEVVDELILQKYPLISYASSEIMFERADRLVIAFDGTESGIREQANGKARIESIIYCFKVYFDTGLIEKFPADLEFEAITNIVDNFGVTPFLKLRRGHLLSGLTRAFDLLA
jgi:hypothetical protein